MKKRSLLALVLAFTLIMSVCTCAFGGLVASAADAMPTFDSATQAQIASGTHLTADYSPAATVLAIDGVKDLNKAVYTKYSVNGVTYSGSGGPYYGSMVYIGAVGDTIYGIRMTNGAGFITGVATEGAEADGSLKNWLSYPGGTNVLPAPVTVTVKNENGTVSVWMSAGENTIVVLDNYAIEGLKPYAGMDNLQGGAEVKATVWVDNSNYKYGVPAYNAADYIDLTFKSGLVTADWVGVTHNAANGATLWTDVNGSGYRNVVNFEEAALLGAETVYGTGTLTYSSSTYAANAAYHYVYLPIANVTMNGNEGYLAFVFRGNNVAGTLAFVTGSGTGTAATDLITFSSITTAIGASHSINYAIDLKNNTLTAVIDGVTVLKAQSIPDGMTLNNVTTGCGSLYARPVLTGYRVYVDTPAELKAPVYDEAKHDIVTTSSAVALSSTSIDKTVYGSVDLSAANAGSNIYDRFLLQIGHATVNWTNANGYQDRTGKWGIYFTRGDSIDMQIPCDDGQHFYYGANYKKYAYPDSGNGNYAGPYNVTYALSATNLKLWVNGILVIDYDYNSWSTASGTQMTTKLNSFVTGYTTSDTGTAVATGSNYKVWTTKTPAPEMDEEAQKEILSFQSTGIKENTNVETYDFRSYVAEDGAVYVSTTVIPEFQFTDWSGPYIALAKTDYKASEDDTKTYYLGVRMSGKYGYFLGLFADDLSQIIISEYNLYSNGTHNIPASIALTYKFDDGKVSAWIDGEMIFDSFSGADYNLTEAVLGGWSLNANGYSLSQVSVWVDNADYDYLGDLNGDMQINLLDFIGMNKIIAQDANYQAFNENVVAFNDEGTVGTDELIMMKKYLLGVIDKLEAASAFGEDTVPADGLL